MRRKNLAAFYLLSHLIPFTRLIQQLIPFVLVSPLVNHGCLIDHQLCMRDERQSLSWLAAHSII
jgi:hypothetical protein